jgi:hypothetical protein
MIKYDYWDKCADKVTNKYMQLLRESHVDFSDIYTGYRTYDKNEQPDLNKWYVAVRLFNNLHKEIDKFPKRNRGIIYATLRKFKF